MTRALVLGSGGPAGVAWQSGLLAGMAERGLDTSNAEFILGTSAGALVGALLALGRSPAQIAAPELAGTVPSDFHGPLPDLNPLAAKAIEAASGKRSPQVVRAEIGAWFRSNDTGGPFSFLTICAVLDLEPSSVRAALARPVVARDASA